MTVPYKLKTDGWWLDESTEWLCQSLASPTGAYDGCSRIYPDDTPANVGMVRRSRTDGTK